jgi:hypothetical protein
MNKVVIIGANEKGLSILPHKESAHNTYEFQSLMYDYQDRIRALMDQPILLAICWKDGDEAAQCTIIPAGEDILKGAEPDEPFKQFKLSFGKTGKKPLSFSVH